MATVDDGAGELNKRWAHLVTGSRRSDLIDEEWTVSPKRGAANEFENDMLAALAGWAFFSIHGIFFGEVPLSSVVEEFQIAAGAGLLYHLSRYLEDLER